MFEFLGDWSEEEKAMFVGIKAEGTAKTNYVINPWRLTKTDKGIKLNSGRKSIKTFTGPASKVFSVIECYYGTQEDSDE